MAGVGATFATADSPWALYLKALSALNMGIRIPESYKKHWSASQDLSEHIHHLKGWNPARNSLVDVIDVDLDNTVRHWSSLDETRFFDSATRADEVDRFVQSLRLSEPEVHTRLLLWHHDQVHQDPMSNVLQDLLFDHIIGIEYDVSLQSILRMLRDNTVKEYIDFPKTYPFNGFHIPHAPGLFNKMTDEPIALSFTWSALRELEMVKCLDIGRRTISSVDIEHVIINMFATKIFQKDDLRWDASKKPSEISKTKAREGHYDLPFVFRESFNSGDWKKVFSTRGTARSHWLDSILRIWLQAHEVGSSGPTWHRIDLHGQRKWLEELEAEQHRRSDWAQSISNQIDTFFDQASNLVDDCKLSRRSLRYATADAKRIATFYQDRLHAESARVSARMAAVTITESRSAIALTVLAFIFVPISLAASVFGMNIQEINNSGHSIWAFVVCAVVMLLVCALTWLIWRFLHNLILILPEFRRKRWLHEMEETPSEEKPSLRQILREREKHRFPRFLYWIGLRKLERAGFGEIG